MDSFNQWDEAGISAVIQTSSPNKYASHENFEQYFTTDYNEDIDNLFNETLTGLQDLDVPTGYITDQVEEPRKQSRKVSGTAIFGFADHNREISIGSFAGDLYKQMKPAPDYPKSISPGEILKAAQNQEDLDQLELPLELGLDQPPPINYDNKILLLEEDEFEVQQELGSFAQLSPIKKQTDFSNEHPKLYRFPPSPSPSRYTSQSNPNSVLRNSAMHNAYNNHYSAKYLQDLNALKDPIDYVDDIEPLLEQSVPLQVPHQQPAAQSFNTPFKYVPIPVQEPIYKKEKQAEQIQQMQQQMQDIQQEIEKQQEIQQQQQKIEHQKLQNQQQMQNIQGQHPQLVQQSQQVHGQQYQQYPAQQINAKLFNTMKSNTFLPPPSPPTLLNGSPEWQSSPEPASPSPTRGSYSSSPIHPQLRNNNVNFHTPQYFLEADQMNNFFNGQQMSVNQQMHLHLTPNLHSSPVSLKSLNSSPVKYYTSPLRNAHQPSNDDTVEMNNSTIAQLTPLRNNLPNTPQRSQIQLEWSPIISPNAKASRDVKRHIKESLARRRIKKTSLLPPGELDQYWVGPDHEKVYTCTYKNCDKKFTRRYNVRSHIQTHLSDRPFGCPHCPKRFVRQHDLNRHVKGHMETTHCKCVCGKEFTRIDALKKHQLRNICVGGMMQPLILNGISKPQRKPRSPDLDDFTLNKLNDVILDNLS